MLLGILVCVGAIISKWFYMLIPTDGSRMSADIVRSSNTNLRIATQATRGSSPFTEQVTVTKEGKVGIGTSNPAQTLDVNGAVTIRGGGAGPGKVLTSTDIYGNATWQTPAAGMKAYTGTVGWVEKFKVNTGESSLACYPDFQSGTGYCYQGYGNALRINCNSGGFGTNLIEIYLAEVIPTGVEWSYFYYLGFCRLYPNGYSN
ncbi:MAG: hypothetical protein A3G59_03685 [Candidatus Taylorbacteria bacterium RIFCSPLOWO2_12_FULL_47_20]|uniref:Uncharacterized protein n=2 Tax=Candidatus Tayloriibacteriota TaxID=1817919 RepID=A0A1G2P6Y2_9BACT|nr:MAG: hypothetical protein A3H68_00110 [Candidatus Taylorbacteria bacterium RIFCSPLOWO2_02_FULL_46_40]OHA43489.1 MAG: hypothetical protein A3G59_03685 [Candidatus Taylorbacteria bacterium RIFCSPLOWO2_12_FULL_47_20]